MRTYGRGLLIAAALAATMMAPVAQAANTLLSVHIAGLDPSGRFPDQAAFCPPPSSTVKDVSPAVTWSVGPKGTQSYALLMTDPDVPQDFSLINKAGTMISADAKRITIYHWVLDDIPATLTSITAGVESSGAVQHGKLIGMTGHGRRGANIFTTFFASNPEMAGTYGGYDGPCPPINDERAHHYIVRVFALDVPSLGLAGSFDGASVEKAMRGHILTEGEAVATYVLNPHLTGRATP